MSTASDLERVFVQDEEISFSLFTVQEQAMLHKGKTNVAIINKLGAMSFREYEYHALFRYFEDFLETLPGWWTPDIHHQFHVVRDFVTRKKNAFAKEEAVSIHSPQNSKQLLISPLDAEERRLRLRVRRSRDFRRLP